MINNLDIQSSRRISEEDVLNFSESIIIMNAFRNTKSLDDWEYVKRRVLLSKISNVNDIDNNIIELSDDYYLPYSNIEFNDDAIVKFISLIEDLKQWCSLLRSIEYVNSNNSNFICFSGFLVVSQRSW